MNSLYILNYWQLYLHCSWELGHQWFNFLLHPVKLSLSVFPNWITRACTNITKLLPSDLAHCSETFQHNDNAFFFLLLMICNILENRIVTPDPMYTHLSKYLRRFGHLFQVSYGLCFSSIRHVLRSAYWWSPYESHWTLDMCLTGSYRGNWGRGFMLLYRIRLVSVASSS